MTMHTLFISDLHLSPNQPEITRHFIDFMRTKARQADALYVLGDLFDFWIGDDDPTPFATSIKNEFKAFTQTGIPCYIIKGNRDFLLGTRFVKETGTTLLGEEVIIELYGKRAVILHGDTLCTQDHRYLAFRKKVNQPWLQWVFNRLPFRLKQNIVRKIQSDIRVDKREKSLEIMDVTQSEVELVMQRNDVDMMIHGHTHRPAQHQFILNNHHCTRVVLGDWYEQGSILLFSSDKHYLMNARNN
jgi:UDP-2,3-diacylglucosamine hydrolase